MRYPRIIAHRCGGALAPENSLAGLHLAARLGCRGVEFDAMLSADGVPVLIHDETLERTTCLAGRVATTSLAELAGADAGLRHHPAFAGEPLPSLRQALSTCQQLGLWANVEIKPSAGFEAETGCAVASIAADFGNLMLSSFSVEALSAAARTMPAVPRALLLDADRPGLARVVRDLDVVGLHLSTDMATEFSMNEIRPMGLAVAVYTVNRRKEAEYLFALGVAAVFTDRPDLWSVGEM